MLLLLLTWGLDIDSRSVWHCSSSITLARSSLVSPLSVINSSIERSPPRLHTRSTGSVTPEYVFGGFASTATTFSRSTLSDGTSTNLSARTSVFVTPRWRRYSSYSSFLSHNENCFNQSYVIKSGIRRRLAWHKMQSTESDTTRQHYSDSLPILVEVFHTMNTSFNWITK